MADKVKRAPAKLSKLVEDFDMEIVCRGSDYDQRTVSISDMNRPALQLVGFYDYFEPKRLQVFGKSEMTFLKAMKLEDRRRVFDNLLSNICKYGLPGSRAYLRTEERGELLRITFLNISRDALNIPAEELMERFVRGDASRSTEGSGLGLSIARSLTELQGGTFTIAIEGDLFKASVELPLTEE